MANFPRVILKAGKEKSVQRYHPWVFSGAIKLIESKVKEGDIVEVYTTDDKFLGIGHYQIGTITVRIFSFERISPDKQFWKSKLIKALELRKKTGLYNNAVTNVFRMVFGESDGMPGLIIDYYAGSVILQCHSIGMFMLRNVFVECLLEIFGDQLVCVFDKSENTLPFKADIQNKNEILFGKAAKTQVSEYGNKFLIDYQEGQKTGFFIDQRENRKILESYCKNADVLNVFCYTGAFSVYALNGGAKTVHSIDASEKAIELTDKNIELNFGATANHRSFCTDAFKFLDTIDNQYDVIILDPPAFAKHNDAVDKALIGYRTINKKAIEKIKSGGILFTFSCSQVIQRDDFRRTIFSAAAMAHKNVKILHQLYQPADHPVNIYHPESEYLKGLILYIE